MNDSTYAQKDALQSIPVTFAHAQQSTHVFSCHQVTWGEFVQLLQGEAARKRHADMVARQNPVFIPAKFNTEGYDQRVAWAERLYHQDMKQPPPTNGDWWASWVTSDVISELCLLAFDIDSGMTEVQVKAALKGREAVYWQTKRSTPTHPRWRVLLLLQRPFVAADYDPSEKARVWKRAYLAAAKQLSLDVDTNCTDLCRRCTLPVGADVVVKHMSGELFDIHAVIDGLEPEPTKEKKAKANNAMGLPPDWKEVLDAISNGDRRTRLLVAMALHHATGGSDDGMDIWSAWASSAWSNPEEHEAEWRRFSSDRDDGVTWATVEYLARQEGWKRVTASYADRWGVINLKGKAMFIDMEQPDIAQALMDERSFLLMHKGDYTTSADGKKTFYRAKEFVDRRPAQTKVFPNGLCFKPAGDCPSGAFNLYKGMRVAPSPDGSCELFKSLIREVWAAGDEDLYTWILEYLMHMLARPGERVRTSIPIRGDGREGKSFVFKLLRKILGDMLLRVTDPNQVIGQFNESVCGKLAVVLEEAAFVGDKKLFDRLKDVVTGETSHVNPKGKPAFTADNFARVFITSNHTHFLYMADDASKERYTVLEASNAWKGQTALFNAVEEEWENGGSERFLWEALQHQFRVIPGTKTLLINKTIVTQHAEMQQDLSRDHVQDLIAQYVGRLIRGFIPSAELMKCVGAGVGDRGASGSIATEMRRLGWKSTKRQRGTVRGWEKGTGGSEFKWAYDSSSFLPLNVPTFFEEEKRRKAEDTEDTQTESASPPLTH